MALPDGITTITLTGSYVAPDGTPLGGQVSFVPSSPLTDPDGMLVIAETPLVARLQAGTGSFSVVLACTDNDDLLPAGWQWRAIIQVPGVQGSFYFDLPSTLGDTHDISALTPHPGAPAASGSYVSSINGQTGDVDLGDGFGILPPAGDLGGTTLSPHVTGTHLAAPLPIAQGGTGAASGSAALAALGGIGVASPAFTGTPTAPTATALTDSTQLATTAYADSAVTASAARARLAGGLFDIASFGADPTGVVDATTAIQAAQAAALAAGGGYVVFGPGTWKHGTISITGVSSSNQYTRPPLVHFRFAGVGSTILTPSAANTPLFNVASGGSPNAAGVRFEGGFTVKAHSSGSTGPAIDLSGARQWVIESPSYLDSLSGAAGSPGTYNSVIGFGINTYACRIVSPVCEGQRLGACFIGSINNATVVANNNVIENPLFESCTASYMIDAAGTGELNIYDGIIEGNTVTAAIRLGQFTRVRGVHFESNAAYAMNAAGADTVNPGTCWLENNVYNTGAGTLTIPSGVSTATVLIGPLGSLTVADATSSYLSVIGAGLTGGSWIGLHSGLRHYPVTVATTSGTVTLEPKSGDYQRITPTGNITIGATSGSQGDGQDLGIEITQPASGGPFTVSWSSQFSFSGGTAPAASVTPGAVDLFVFRWNSTASKWGEVSHRINYKTAAQIQSANTYTGDNYFKSGRPWFDVAAFGADPTGTSDSTLAITTAFNTAMGLRTDTGVGMTASSTTVTDSSAVSGDAGLYVNSPNFPLGCSLISSVTPGVGYTVATAATATLSGQVCGIGTGSAVVARTATGPVFIPSGTYKVSSDLLVQSVTGFQLIGAGAGTTALRATGTAFTNAVLTIDGSLDGIFAGFVVQGDGTEGAGSAGIPMGIGLTWTSSAARSTSANTFRNLRIRNLNFISGLNLAGVGSNQTDGTSVHDVVVTGGQFKGGWTTAARTDTGVCGTTSASATVTDTAAATGDLLKPISGPGIPSGSTITAVSAGTGYTISANATATASGVTFSVGTSSWQQGFVFGNGTFGNDYDHELYNCSATRCYYGWYCNASGFGLWGAQPTNNGCDFYVIPAAQVTIENVQSQNGGQLLSGPSGSGLAPCSARDIRFSGFATPLAAAGTTWVSVLGAGGSESWVFESVFNKTTYTSGSPVMAFNCSGGSTKEQVTLINVRQGASPSSGVTVTGGGSVIAVNYIDTSTTPNTAYPLWLANASVALNSGLTGATHASRWIGATTSGAPASGTFSAGDFCVDQSGLIWVYTGSAWSSHTFTGGTLTSFVAPAVVTLTDASSIAVNAALGNDFRLTLTASGHTLANPTNPVDGQAMKVQITQPASGGPFTLSYGTAYEFSTGLPSPTLSIGASATDLLGFIYNAAKSKWLFCAYVNGYA